MFDELKDDLERRQQAEWPQISGIGDILLDHFDLESEKGMNFQQQVAKWISCDADANKEVKKYQDQINSRINQISTILNNSIANSPNLKSQ